LETSWQINNQEFRFIISLKAKCRI